MRRAVRHALRGTTIAVVGAAVLLSAACRPDKPDIDYTKAAPWVFAGSTMGTTYHVTIALPPMGQDTRRALERRIKDILDDVDAKMSTYKSTSEASQFNAARAGQAVPVSSDTMRVVRLALTVARLSEGAFDPTIEPLVELWGFGANRSVPLVPDKIDLAVAGELVNYRKLIADKQTGSLTKKQDGVQIDLSAVAKGYAVDKAHDALVAAGYPNVMVEVGGEVRTHGLNADRVPWRIGVDRPNPEAKTGTELELVLGVTDTAVATSGDYRNYRIVDGKRISHTIDPKTRRPVEHGLASVSVVAPTCALADALATAANVLGPEKGLRLLEEHERAEGYLIVHDGTAFRSLKTSGFDRYIAK
ncbi:MAG: FAD:protein FMN transferase [Deltaproteobacteria bacterium]|nr:FAD:protein FMN transferase [Deltaproteobacteria bacterium]